MTAAARLTTSPEETAALGRDLAATVQPGAIVLLVGDLGAGKTVFVRGLAEGLGIDPADVTSPTFTLVQEYRSGRLPLYHVDLYRLRAIDVDDLGLDDERMAQGVTAIEWPDRLPRPAPAAIVVRIEHGEGDARRITVTAPVPLG